MNPAQDMKVAIIGAGVAGLATAKALRRKGINCTVYDRGARLGGVWAVGYVGFGVQVQRDLYEFPDFPLPAGPEDFTPGPQFRKYLEAYCRKFGIEDRIQLGSNVLSVTRTASGGWTLSIDHGDSKSEEEADFLVVATGLYSETPFVPEVPGLETFSGKVKHSSDVKDLEDMQGCDVVVVGYGKSAADIAAGAVPVAKSVRLVFRTAHWPVPRKLLGMLPFKWGMLTRLTASLIPPYVRASPAVRLLHSVGKPLPWLFWRVVEILLRAQQKLGTRIENGKNLIPDYDVLFDAYSERTMVPRPGFFELIRSGNLLAHRSGISHFEKDAVVLSDGTTLKSNYMVFGTGWENTDKVLPEELKADLGFEEDGLYLYRHMLSARVPSLAFVGRVSTFMSVTTYALQARWLADMLSGEVHLPPSLDMEQSVADLRAWKRSWMPAGPARSGTLLLHMAHYHDELLIDLGEDPLRKRGLLAPLKELLVPYRAEDFREVV